MITIARNTVFTTIGVHSALHHPPVRKSVLQGAARTRLLGEHFEQQILERWLAPKPLRDWHGAVQDHVNKLPLRFGLERAVSRDQRVKDAAGGPHVGQEPRIPLALVKQLSMFGQCHQIHTGCLDASGVPQKLLRGRCSWLPARSAALSSEVACLVP